MILMIEYRTKRPALIHEYRSYNIFYWTMSNVRPLFWSLLTLSLLLKLPPRKLEPWFVLWSFFLLKLLCISMSLPCMKYCCHIWDVSWNLGSLLKCSQLKSFYKHYFGRCSSELVPIHYSQGRSTPYPDRLHDFLSPFLDVTRTSMSTVSFLTQLDLGILCLYNAFLWPMI